MADRQKITFHQEGDQVPGLEPGDIVIVLDQKEHPIFQRRGNDLIVKKEIDLVDALCGCKTVIHTLDNRRLLVTSRPGGQGRALGAAEGGGVRGMGFHVEKPGLWVSQGSSRHSPPIFNIDSARASLGATPGEGLLVRQQESLCQPVEARLGKWAA